MHQGLEAAVFPAGLITLRRPLLAKCLSTLARLDVRVAPWGARWRDHFLLMTGLGVWDFRVNALISDRRGRNHALMLGWGRGPRPSSVPGGSLPCGMLFSTVSCVSPLEAARPVSGTKQKPKKISAAPMGQLTARARTILVQSYLQYRFCWGFLLRWIECGESTPGVRRSELQRCPLGHIYDHRMDLTQIRSRWRNSPSPTVWRLQGSMHE